MVRFGFLSLGMALCMAVAGCATAPPSARGPAGAAKALPAGGLPRVISDPTRAALVADRVSQNVKTFSARLEPFDFTVYGRLKIIMPSRVRTRQYAEDAVRRQPYNFAGLKTQAEKIRAAEEPFSVDISTVARIMAKRRLVSDISILRSDDPGAEPAGPADMVLWTHFPEGGGFEWRMRTWDSSRSRALIHKVGGRDKSLNYELLILDAEVFIVGNSAIFPELGYRRWKSDERFPDRGMAVRFPAKRLARDDVAVIIGNANYNRRRGDIPDVVPAYADNDLMRRYATVSLGVTARNMISLTDATLADFIRVFGSVKNPRGKLHDMVKPNSNVFIYYSGHGAPAQKGEGSFLVPSDAAAARIHLTGYPLKTLYANLEKLSAKSVTVVLEACFSGLSQGGSIIPSATAIAVTPKTVRPPSKLTVISAGASDQIASWDVGQGQGLFTKHFASAMRGTADSNRDGKVSLGELKAYLDRNLTYDARRYYGRDQNAQIFTGGVALGP